MGENMKGDTKVIEYLNKALENELTAINRKRPSAPHILTH